LRHGPAASDLEKSQVKQLILTNTTQKEVVLEGSVQLLKNILSKNIAVKPPCLFDGNIVVNIKVMYAVNGQYSEKRSRDLSLDISQI